MTTMEPKVSDAGRYSVMETCAALEIHRNTLCKWTREGKIKCGIRRVTNRLFYTGAEIKKVWRMQL